MEKLKEFIRESKTFAGFTFDGCYDMKNGVFFHLFNHYIKTGENLLDAYTHLTHLSWDIESEKNEHMFGEVIFLQYKDYIRKCYSLGLFDYDMSVTFYKKILEYRECERMWGNSGRARVMACSFTANEKVRKEIFDKYGERCLCCGSEENIALDHITPVALGGKDEIANLQPLCKKCNSKKRTKIIDYRPKEGEFIL